MKHSQSFLKYFLKLLRIDIPIDFYKEALCAWQKIKRSTPNTKKQVLNEIVWNNHHIKIDGYSICWHDAAELTKIEDFFQVNSFLAFEEFCSKFKIKTNFLTTTVYATRSPKNGSIFLKEILLNLQKNVLRRKGYLWINSLADLRLNSLLRVNSLSLRIRIQLNKDDRSRPKRAYNTTYLEPSF